MQTAKKSSLFVQGISLNTRGGFHLENEHCLSSLVCLVLTHIHSFHDISGITRILPGTEPPTLGLAVILALHSTTRGAWDKETTPPPLLLFQHAITKWIATRTSFTMTRHAFCRSACKMAPCKLFGDAVFFELALKFPFAGNRSSELLLVDPEAFPGKALHWGFWFRFLSLKNGGETRPKNAKGIAKMRGNHCAYISSAGSHGGLWREVFSLWRYRCVSRHLFHPARVLALPCKGDLPKGSEVFWSMSFYLLWILFLGDTRRRYEGGGTISPRIPYPWGEPCRQLWSLVVSHLCTRPTAISKSSERQSQCPHEIDSLRCEVPSEFFLGAWAVWWYLAGVPEHCALRWLAIWCLCTAGRCCQLLPLHASRDNSVLSFCGGACMAFHHMVFVLTFLLVKFGWRQGGFFFCTSARIKKKRSSNKSCPVRTADYLFH